jgi:hypothetical protein
VLNDNVGTSQSQAPKVRVHRVASKPYRESRKEGAVQTEFTKLGVGLQRKRKLAALVRDVTVDVEIESLKIGQFLNERDWAIDPRGRLHHPGDTSDGGEPRKDGDMPLNHAEIVGCLEEVGPEGSLIEEHSNESFKSRYRSDCSVGPRRTAVIKNQADIARIVLKRR